MGRGEKKLDDPVYLQFYLSYVQKHLLFAVFPKLKLPILYVNIILLLTCSIDRIEG